MQDTENTELAQEITKDKLEEESSSSASSTEEERESADESDEEGSSVASEDEGQRAAPVPSGEKADRTEAKRSRGGGLRSGKWKAEESAFAARLIVDFEAGTLDIENGSQLRAFLAEKLCCAPMRISKKFSGEKSLGKKTYKRRTDLVIDEREEQALRELETKHLRSIAHESSRRRSGALTARGAARAVVAAGAAEGGASAPAGTTVGANSAPVSNDSNGGGATVAGLPSAKGERASEPRRKRCRKEMEGESLPELSNCIGRTAMGTKDAEALGCFASPLAFEMSNWSDEPVSCTLLPREEADTGEADIGLFGDHDGLLQLEDDAPPQTWPQGEKASEADVGMSLLEFDSLADLFPGANAAPASAFEFT